MSLSPGTTLGPYEILSIAGSGGMRPPLLFSGEFGADIFYVTYDVHPDGKRFVIWQPTTTTATNHLQFVFNWFTELQKSVKR